MIVHVGIIIKLSQPNQRGSPFIDDTALLTVGFWLGYDMFAGKMGRKPVFGYTQWFEFL